MQAAQQVQLVPVRVLRQRPQEPLEQPPLARSPVRVPSAQQQVPQPPELPAQQQLRSLLQQQQASQAQKQPGAQPSWVALVPGLLVPLQPQVDERLPGRPEACWQSLELGGAQQYSRADAATAQCAGVRSQQMQLVPQQQLEVRTVRFWQVPTPQAGELVLQPLA